MQSAELSGYTLSCNSSVLYESMHVSLKISIHTFKNVMSECAEMHSPCLSIVGRGNLLGCTLKGSNQG